MLNGLDGLKHVSLYTYDMKAMIDFYTDVIGMEIVSKPDERNIYLKAGGTVLALHQRLSTTNAKPVQILDHIGFTFSSVADVMAAHLELTHAGFTCGGLKEHHDGSVGFYVLDPCGNSVELICMGENYA